MSEGEGTTVKRLRIRLRVSDYLSLSRAFKANLSTSGVFLKSVTPLPIDCPVIVEILFATGDVALRGEGRVEEHRAGGMVIGLEWDGASEPRLREVLSYPSLPPPERRSVPPPRSPSSPAPRISLVEESPPVPAVLLRPSIPPPPPPRLEEPSSIEPVTPAAAEPVEAPPVAPTFVAAAEPDLAPVGEPAGEGALGEAAPPPGPMESPPALEAVAPVEAEPAMSAPPPVLVEAATPAEPAMLAPPPVLVEAAAPVEAEPAMPVPPPVEAEPAPPPVLVDAAAPVEAEPAMPAPPPVLVEAAASVEAEPAMLVPPRVEAEPAMPAPPPVLVEAAASVEAEPAMLVPPQVEAEPAMPIASVEAESPPALDSAAPVEAESPPALESAAPVEAESPPALESAAPVEAEPAMPAPSPALESAAPIEADARAAVEAAPAPAPPAEPAAPVDVAPGAPPPAIDDMLAEYTSGSFPVPAAVAEAARGELEPEPPRDRPASIPGRGSGLTRTSLSAPRRPAGERPSSEASPAPVEPWKVPPVDEGREPEARTGWVESLHRLTRPRGLSLSEGNRLGPRSRTSIGIDLGTHVCSAAVSDGERPKMLLSRQGPPLIPALVGFTEADETLVGHAAVRLSLSHPRAVIAGAKRLLGRNSSSPVVGHVKARSRFEVVPGERGEVALRVGARTLSVEDVLALVLAEIRECTRLTLGEDVNRAVITCPAYYSDRQREAVESAGRIAGLYVERVLAEPIAAVLGMGVKGQAGKRRVLVYDFGAGTFDASLVSIDGGTYEIEASASDTFASGHEVDAKIVAHAAEAIERAHGVDPQQHELTAARLEYAAERAKRELSEATDATLRVEHAVRDDPRPTVFEVALSRTKLEELMEPLVTRTLSLADDVCRRAGVEPAAVDEILLVGGQTRAPIVRRKVREHFAKEPRRDVAPDEAIALGAGQYAFALDHAEGEVRVEKLPMSIGIGLPGGRMKRILEKDAALPVSRTYPIHTTRDQQTELVLEVYQGEEEFLEKDELVGTLRLSGLPPKPKGAIEVKVVFRVTGQGVLELTAEDDATHKKVKLQLAISCTDEEVKRKLGLRPAAPKGAAPRPASTAEKTTFWGWVKKNFS